MTQTVLKTNKKRADQQPLNKLLFRSLEGVEELPEDLKEHLEIIDELLDVGVLVGGGFVSHGIHLALLIDVSVSRISRQ